MQYCLQCNAALLPGDGKCRDCGWLSADSGGAPTLDELQREMVGMMISVTGAGTREKVADFLNMIEPQRQHERPVQVGVAGTSGGNRNRWAWNYATRAKNCLRLFLSMSRADQDTIKAAREDNIFWRGDDLAFFMSVIEETMKMRGMGIDKYRAECLERQSILTRGVVL